MKLRENEDWVEDNFASCEFGDARLTKRLVKLANNMLNAPEASVTEQNVAWADVKGAYRFFGNEKAKFNDIASSHWNHVRQTRRGRFLLISDTTDIDHTSRKATTGLGMLGDGGGRGMQLHNCLMFDCDNQQIRGSAGALIYYRKPKPENETRMRRLNRIRESSVWGMLVDQVGEAPEESQWIHVFDRGGDNFEAMCHIMQSGNDWVIRASKMTRKVFTNDGRKMPLKEAVNEARALGDYELQLRSRPGVAARTATLRLAVVSVTLPRPSQYSKWVRQCGIREIKTQVVIVEEVDAPKKVTPIRWVLLTSLPVRTFDDAWQVVDDYENRWLVEEYHKVMKTGCSLEKRALRTADRLEAIVGLISVIGIRLFQLKLIGRNQPDIKAKSHVPKSWIEALKLIQPKVKMTGLTVYGFFREVAKLGGFLARKHDGEPGWQTIWRGYQKLSSVLDALRLTRGNSMT